MSILDPFWDPPWVPNRPLERPGAATGGQKGQSTELRSRSRGRLGNDQCSKGVPQAIPIDFGTPLGDLGARWDPPWVTQGAFWDLHWVTKARISQDF